MSSKNEQDKPIFRAKYLPSFVTPDWVRDNIGISKTEMARIEKFLAEKMPDWTGSEIEDGKFHSKLARDIGVVGLLQLSVHAVKKSKARPPFLVTLNRRLFDAVSNKPKQARQQISIKTIEARELLARSNKWELLVEILFCELLLDIEIDHAEKIMDDHAQIREELAPFWTSYGAAYQKCSEYEEEGNEEDEKSPTIQVSAEIDNDVTEIENESAISTAIRENWKNAAKVAGKILNDVADDSPNLSVVI
jgi:hypothetical protein